MVLGKLPVPVSPTNFGGGAKVLCKLSMYLR